MNPKQRLQSRRRIRFLNEQFELATNANSLPPNQLSTLHPNNSFIANLNGNTVVVNIPPNDQ